MAKLIDYKCRYSEFTGISSEFVAALGFQLPDVYKEAEGIAAMAAAIRKAHDNVFCIPSFDPVIEAENMGADIKFDESNLGPRKNTEIITTLEELLALPKLDVTKGRLAETLKACEILKAQGEKVAIEVHGPFAIINGVMEIQTVLMQWRKKADLVQQIFEKFKDDLVPLFLAAREVGCDMLFYTDAPGGLNIMGPKYTKQIVDWFTYPMVKELEEKLDKDAILHLCSKTAFALAGCDKAVWEKYSIEKEMKYGEACLLEEAHGKILGQRCRKEENFLIRSHINYLKLL